jgi:hypothetical protein
MDSAKHNEETLIVLLGQGSFELVGVGSDSIPS